MFKDQLTDVRVMIRPLLHNFMTPLPDGIFDPDTSHPINPQYDIREDTAQDLIDIKRAYMPSIILAYNGVIAYASKFLGPETLLKSLELANLLADDQNADLARVIVDAGRMVDLVTGLALSQKRLITMQQNLATLQKREAEAERSLRGKGSKTRGVVRKKRSGLTVKKREWKGETLDLWDASQPT